MQSGNKLVKNMVGLFVISPLLMQMGWCQVRSSKPVVAPAKASASQKSKPMKKANKAPIKAPVMVASKSGLFNLREFPISYWVGPPGENQTLERYREIKESGMTFVMPSGAGPSNVRDNLKTLDHSAKLGMKAFIWEERMPLSISDNPNATATLDALIKDYKDHPGFAGFMILDEPSASRFDGLGEVVAYLRKHDPTHQSYMNVFPNYAGPAHWGTETYEEYLRQYMQKVKPFVLSYDHYNFVKNADRPEFFENLAVVQRVAKEFNVPFWQFVMVAEIDAYRHLSEGELRFEAMQTLAYGGKGLLWFTYWQYSTWRHALINIDGKRDPHYDMVRRINGEVRAFGSELLPADLVTVFHSGPTPRGAQARPAGTPIEVTGQGNLTIGLFERNKSEHLAFVVNMDYKQAQKTEVVIYGGKAPLKFNPATRTWAKVPVKAQPGGFRVALDLPESGAVLLKW
jgi:hypothetical protein